MFRKAVLSLGGALLLALVTTSSWGQLPPDQIARLGADLTPLGAEKAGNADGTIPAWEGGITAPPAGYQPGDHHPDPYPGDDILFTITAPGAPGVPSGPW